MSGDTEDREIVELLPREQQTPHEQREIAEICPLMSAHQVVKPSESNLVGMQVLSQPIPIMVRCVGRRCALWVESHDGYGCALVGSVVIGNLAGISHTLAEINAKLAQLEPPKYGKSPVGRIADALEALVRAAKLKAETAELKAAEVEAARKDGKKGT